MLMNGLLTAAGVAEEEEAAAEEEEEAVSGMERLRTASLDKNCRKFSKVANVYHRYYRYRNHHHHHSSSNQQLPSPAWRTKESRRSCTHRTAPPPRCLRQSRLVSEWVGW